MVSQAAVDESVFNFIIGSLQPLRVVEHPDFISLITTLQPNRRVMSRQTLRSRVTEAAKQMTQKLVTTLGEQAAVATTTDCWTAYGKSYMGVTVHWMDVATLERKSACLALRRLKGSHTYDVIAATLNDIHAQYGIRRKVTRTTTDNGANFVKAFSVFAQVPTDNNDTEDRSEEAGAEDYDDQVPEVLDVDSALSEGDSQTETDFNLPRHHRCACHTLNLIATTDADKAEENPQFKKVSRSAFGKCQSLWNKYGRSATAVETVTDSFGLGLKRPNATRWNSVFMATERLTRIINEKGDDELRSVCAKLGVPRFTDAETSFLAEYTSVMKPVAQALNILQSESKMFMGYLLPTVSILRQTLLEKQTAAHACGPLITALIDGIDRRFDAVFTDKDATAAAILHPKFKTTWTDNQRLIDTGMQHIRNLLATTAAAASTSQQPTGMPLTSVAADDDEDQFFKQRTGSNANQSNSGDALVQYLQSNSEETACLSAWPELKQLFIRLNTPLPASAASERLFSCAGLVMNSRRTRMSDALFEELVLLKKNKDIVLAQ